VIESGTYDRIGKGAMEFTTARERFIDDFLRACLSERLDRTVILGAGFDTRAYRIAGIDKTRVFEVDHLDTQEVRLRRLKKATILRDGSQIQVSVELAERATQSSSPN